MARLRTPKNGSRFRRQAGVLLAAQMGWSACAAAPPAREKKPAPKPEIRKPAASTKPGAPKVSPGPSAAPGAPLPAFGLPVAAPPAIVAAAGAPPGTIKLDFRGTNIDTVLQAYALAFKWTVVKDPACSGEVTVIETQPLDQQRAMAVL